MKKSKEELLTSVKTLLGDRTDDEALTIIEDINDSFGEEGEDWKAKYDENETAWRKKYRDRFFQSPDIKETDPETVIKDNEEDLKDEGEVKEFDALFKEKEENNGY